MDAPTTTAHALLGLLSIRPWTGYELAMQIERSLGWFWPRTPRRIYDDTKKLVDRGLASAESAPTGRRRAMRYDITPQGRDLLAAWLTEPSAPPKLESEALVRVFLADAGTLEDLRSTLTTLATECEARVAVLHSMVEVFDDPDYHFTGRRHINALAVRFQFDQQQAMATWAHWALDQCRDWTSTSDPGTWDWRTALE